MSDLRSESRIRTAEEAGNSRGVSRNIFHSFLLIFLCFSMTSIAWLAWVYHLMGIIHDPVRIDLITLVAGYLSQAGGLCLFICLDRSVSRSRRQDFLHIYGYSVFSASTAVFFLCCIPAVLSRFPAGTFVFGCLMNVAIGMIAGFYLHDLAARVDKKRRGTVFGSSYGLSSIWQGIQTSCIPPMYSFSSWSCAQLP